MQKLKLALLMIVTICGSNAYGQLPLTFDAFFDIPGVVENVNIAGTAAWNTSNVAANRWVNNSGAQTFFTNGNSVVFGRDGAGTGAMSITIEASVSSVGDMTIANVAPTGSGTLGDPFVFLNYTFTGSGLVGSPSSTLLVNSNAGSTTTFSNAGNQFDNFTLKQGSVAGSAGISVSSNISLESGSVSTVLSGAGAATKSTIGTVTLSGANTYTGGTNVNAGTLALGASNVLADTGAVNVGGGNLSIGTNSDTVGVVTLTSGSISGTTGVLTGSSYAVESGTISARLGGTGGLTKTTAGTVTLTGANSYSGSTIVSAGTLALGASDVLSNDSIVIVSTGTLDIGTASDTVRAVVLANGGSITGTTGVLTSSTTFSLSSGNVSAILGGSGHLIKGSAGTVTLTGANTYTGNTDIDEGTLVLGASGVLADVSDVFLFNGSTLALGANNETVRTVTLDSGSITGTGTLTANSFSVQAGTIEVNLAGGSLSKSTTGSVTLSGNNTYSGGTNINAGTLVVNSTNALGTGAVSVGSGATLNGNADIANTINLASGSMLTGEGIYSSAINLAGVTVSPGNSPGTLTINNALTASSSTVFNFELNGANQFVGGNINDLITGITNLTLDGTLNITNWLNAFSAPGGTWTLFQYSGTLTDNGLVIGTAPSLPSGLSYLISAGSGRVDLIITAVPEPSSMMLVILGTAGLAIRRRARR